jgi:hypothetical protein
MAAGMLSEAQYDAELKVIQSHRDGLVQVTEAYNNVSQAMIDQAAQSLTATTVPRSSRRRARARQSDRAHRQRYRGSGQEDREDLPGRSGRQSRSTRRPTASLHQGLKIGRKRSKSRSSARKGKARRDHREQRKGIDDQIKQVKQSYADQERAAAASYARQQIAQKQHLGQMLIDYTVAQASLGNIAKDRAAEITSALEKEYGLQESSTATTFLHMAESIDKFASDAGATLTIDHRSA